MQTVKTQACKNIDIEDASRVDNLNIDTLNILDEVDNKTYKNIDIEDVSRADNPSISKTDVDKIDNWSMTDITDADKAKWQQHGNRLS